MQTSTIPAGTLMFTVTFAVAYGAAPVVIVNNMAGQQTSSVFIAGSVGTCSFTVYNSATLPVTTQMRVGYHVIG